MKPLETYLPNLDWHQVDDAADPGVYAAYLDRLDAETVMEQRRQSFVDLLPTKSGDRVLDAGCGTGSDSQLLAQKVGTSGQVLGLDFSQSLLRHAKARRTNVIAYAAGSLLRLPLTDNAFDGAFCNRVLMHLNNPQQAVCQLVAALKPGAWLALCEPDWSDSRLEPDGPISRALIKTHCAGFTNGSIGGELAHLLNAAGCPPFRVDEKKDQLRDFDQVMTLANLERSLQHLHHSGHYSADQLQQWRQQMEAAAAEGLFSCQLSMTVAIGRKGHI